MRKKRMNEREGIKNKQINKRMQIVDTSLPDSRHNNINILQLETDRKEEEGREGKRERVRK